MEVEVTVGSARELKNVNWRHGELKPYAVLWINDDGPKCSTRVVLDNGENPDWGDEKVVVPLPPSAANNRLEDAVLYIDIVHANADEDVKPLVGSARLPLRDVIDEIIGGNKVSRTLRLKRPSGRPQGRLDVRVAIREPAARYYDPNSPYPSPYPYNQQYGQPVPYAAPPTGYPVPAAAAAGYGYGGGAPPQPQYGAAPPPAMAVDDPSSQKKTGSNKMGMGTGLAVGAAAGVLGGLALAGGASYLEDKFEENVAERVEEDLATRDDDDDDY